MRICNKCGHVFESSAFKCEKCESFDIKQVDPYEKIKEEDWVKLLSPSRKTIKSVTFVFLVVIVAFIVSPFIDAQLARLLGQILSLFNKH